MSSERITMSNVDTAWLRMEDPTNLMMITGLMIFDEPLEFDMLQKIIEERFLRFKRFRMRVVESGIPLVNPEWEIDPNFDIRAHLQRIALPAPGDKQALEEVVSNLMSTPLDFSKPPWQFHLIENVSGGSVVAARMHHCIADGIAMVRVMLAMTDDSAQTETRDLERPKKKKRSSPISTFLDSAFDATETALNFGETLFNETVETIRNPERLVEAAKFGADSATVLGQLLTKTPDPQTVFKGKLGPIKKGVWSAPIPLADIKAIGKKFDGTVNDILLTIMSGALRDYMADRGDTVDELVIRAAVPVNLRSLEGPIELGNKFGLVFLELPINFGDPLERLRELKRRMAEIKGSAEAVVAFGVLSAIGWTSKDIQEFFVGIFGAKITAVMTNVPGPREPISLGGKTIKNMMFWVPQSGKAGLGISIFSYAGTVMLGIAADAGLCPDPEKIAAYFNQEFEEFRQLAGIIPAVSDKPADKE